MNIDKKLIEEAMALCGDDSTRAKMIHDLLKRAIAPEPRFYYNQPVLVSDGTVAPHVPAFFRGYKDGLFVTVGALSGIDELTWENCIPDPKAVSIPNWLPTVNGGTPLGVISNDTETVRFSKDKTMYCILPEPVYLEVSDE